MLVLMGGDSWGGDGTVFCTDYTVGECSMPHHTFLGGQGFVVLTVITDPKMERYPKLWTNIISSAGANNNSLCRLYRYPTRPASLQPS